jgi:hypothetical protein
MIKKSVSQELSFGFLSKQYYYIIVLLVLLMSVVLYLNYSAAREAYNEYLRTEEYYQKNDMDTSVDLSDDYSVEKNQFGAEEITNPLKYYKESVGKYIYASSPAYSLRLIAESSVMLFPFIFSILGILAATNDLRYKTVKVKTVRNSRFMYNASKQIALLLSGVFTFVISVTLTFFVGLAAYGLLCSSIPIQQFPWTPSFLQPMILQLFFALAVALLFAQIGFLVGNLSKSTLLSAIFIVVYVYIVPNLGRFDLKNLLYVLAQNLFPFYGVITIESGHNVSTVVAIVILMAVAVLCYTLSSYVVSRRSSYDS